MLNLLAARNGDPAILNRTGGMQCGDALEGNVRQIRWGYCELLSQGHQNMRGPGTTLVIGKRIAPRCGLQMETPAHAIGVRLDPTLKTGLAAEIHAAVSFRVCRVGHEHEQAWGHLTAIGKRPAFGRSMTDNHYAKWQEGLWRVCTPVQAQEVAGCFFGAEPSRGPYPPGRVSAAPARSAENSARRGCFFGESRSDLGWLALLFDGKPSQYLCRLLQAKLGKAAEIGVKRERRFLQTALDR